MDILLRGDDNREIKVTIPATATLKDIKELIAESLLVSKADAMKLHLEKATVLEEDGMEQEYITLFESLKMDDTLAASDHLESGDTIYVENCSSFSDPNVWLLNEEWNKLLDHQLDWDIMFKFVSLMTRICENLISDPQNERWRHLNFDKISKKIKDIPNGMDIFKRIGFVKREMDFQYLSIHSQQPLLHFLHCVYLKFPSLRPKDAVFMTKFADFDANSMKFESEKRAEEEEIQRIMNERKEHYQNLKPDPSAIVPPSTGTVVANKCHRVLENSVLFVILLSFVVWLIRGIFKF